MTGPSEEAYAAARIAMHDAGCTDRTCCATVIGSVYGKKARAAVDAVWDLGVAEGQRLAADLAKAVLVMAASAAVPDSYWGTDTRIALACDTLGWTPQQALGWVFDLTRAREGLAGDDLDDPSAGIEVEE